ncbi:MAG: hypothetical protein AB7O91_10080 [Sphingomonas sp.]
MQRVRIGLTGLAFVFVAVLLAAALTNEPAGETEITPNLIDQQQGGRMQSMPAAAAPVAPTEPLAELGVAPGKAEANSVTPPPAAPTGEAQ